MILQEPVLDHCAVSTYVHVGCLIAKRLTHFELNEVTPVYPGIQSGVPGTLNSHSNSLRKSREQSTLSVERVSCMIYLVTAPAFMSNEYQNL